MIKSSMVCKDYARINGGRYLHFACEVVDASRPSLTDSQLIHLLGGKHQLTFFLFLFLLLLFLLFLLLLFFVVLFLVALFFVVFVSCCSVFSHFLFLMFDLLLFVLLVLPVVLGIIVLLVLLVLLLFLLLLLSLLVLLLLLLLLLSQESCSKTKEAKQTSTWLCRIPQLLPLAALRYLLLRGHHRRGQRAVETPAMRGKWSALFCFFRQKFTLKGDGWKIMLRFIQISSFGLAGKNQA